MNGSPPATPAGDPTAFPPIAEAPYPSPPASESFLFGFGMARRRLLNRRVGLLAFLGLALAIVAALVERHITPVGAADRALLSTFRLVIPLVSFAIVTEVSARSRLAEAAWPAARFGAGPREVALGVIAGALITSACVSAVYAASAVLFAGSSSSTSVARDALTSAWIGAFAASAYVGWFSLGSTFQRRGRARFWPLLADLLLGGSTGIAGALLPRGNAVNLLGGPAPLALSQHASAGLLLASALVLSLFAALRSDR